MKVIGLFSAGILSLGAAIMESAPPQTKAVKTVHGVHVDTRFDAAFHGVVEEVSFLDVTSF